MLGILWAKSTIFSRKNALLWETPSSLRIRRIDFQGILGVWEGLRPFPRNISNHCERIGLKPGLERVSIETADRWVRHAADLVRDVVTEPVTHASACRPWHSIALERVQQWRQPKKKVCSPPPPHCRLSFSDKSVKDIIPFQERLRGHSLLCVHVYFYSTPFGCSGFICLLNQCGGLASGTKSTVVSTGFVGISGIQWTSASFNVFV